MNQFQKRVDAFSEKRNWRQYHNPKDLLLGIVEEVGELRNIIKWEQDPEKLRTALETHRGEVEDDIGDLYWFLCLLANSAGVDIDEAIMRVIEKNELRFPPEKTTSQHTNTHLGGHDGKYSV